MAAAAGQNENEGQGTPSEKCKDNIVTRSIKVERFTVYNLVVLY